MNARTSCYRCSHAGFCGKLANGLNYLVEAASLPASPLGTGLSLVISAMTPPEGAADPVTLRGRRRSHHACVTCRSVIPTVSPSFCALSSALSAILADYLVTQAEKDPVSGGEASMLELCPAQAAMFLSCEKTITRRAIGTFAKSKKGENGPLNGSQALTINRMRDCNT